MVFSSNKESADLVELLSRPRVSSTKRVDGASAGFSGIGGAAGFESAGMTTGAATGGLAGASGIRMGAPTLTRQQPQLQPLYGHQSQGSAMDQRRQLSNQVVNGSGGGVGGSGASASASATSFPPPSQLLQSSQPLQSQSQTPESSAAFFHLQRRPSSASSLLDNSSQMQQLQQQLLYPPTIVSPPPPEDDGVVPGSSSAAAAAAAPSPLVSTTTTTTTIAGSFQARSSQPILRSALRKSHGGASTSRNELNVFPTTFLGASPAADVGVGGGGGNTSPIMKKHPSVTFCDSTKVGSYLGMIGGNNTHAANTNYDGGVEFQPLANMRMQVAMVPQFHPVTSATTTTGVGGGAGGTDYSAEAMLKKSQSIASTASSSTTEVEGASSNIVRPLLNPASVYMPVSASSQYNVEQPPPLQSHLLHHFEQSPPKPPTTTQRSKSVNTLQYYYPNKQHTGNGSASYLRTQELLQAAGISGMVRTPVTSHCSINGLNLTFRDMLDEGDGIEGDLNAHTRNQQWKDFRTFSAGLTEGGYSRRSSSSSSTSSTSKRQSPPLSGSKRVHAPTVSPSAGPARNTRPLSVNDLFMIPQGVGASNGVAPTASTSTRSRGRSSLNATPRLPGETLGGMMLSRTASINTTAPVVGNSVFPTTTTTTSTSTMDSSSSPMAQMFAKHARSSHDIRSSNIQDSDPQLLELFMQRASSYIGGANATTNSKSSVKLIADGSINNTTDSTIGPRRHTVGAGLAYGSANMTINYTPNGMRLSTFNLGELQRDEGTMNRYNGIPSTGGGNADGRRNEEWVFS